MFHLFSVSLQKSYDGQRSNMIVDTQNDENNEDNLGLFCDGKRSFRLTRVWERKG